MLSIYECEECAHQFTVLPKDKRERYSQEYFLETHKNWFLHPDIGLFDNVISKIKKSAPKVLDVGCGQGAFLKHFYEKDKKANLYGIDLIQNQHPGITFIQGDFETQVFDTTFDVVTGFMVIEHIDNPQIFVRKIHSLLVPNGVMILNTISSSGLLYVFARAFKICGWRGPWERLYNHHHLQHYSFFSLKKLITANGFIIIDHRNHNFPLAAVDVPGGSKLLKIIYKTGIAFVFALNFLFGWGMNQTIICKKKVT